MGALPMALKHTLIVLTVVGFVVFLTLPFTLPLRHPVEIASVPST